MLSSKWTIAYALRSAVAVRAGSPKGDPARRERLRTHPLVVQSGPYLIGGYLHAHPGIGPRDEIEGRPPMVPLSLGWLEYWIDGRRRAQWAGTIVFNRGLVDAIVLTPAEGALEAFAVHRASRSPAAIAARDSGLRIELRGNLAAMLGAAQNATRSPETGDLVVRMAVVAGAGFEPATFGL